MDLERLQIKVLLTADEAESLVQYLKRVGFSDYRRLARDEAEGYAMLVAAERVREALALAGYAPR